MKFYLWCDVTRVENGDTNIVPTRLEDIVGGATLYFKPTHVESKWQDCSCWISPMMREVSKFGSSEGQEGFGLKVKEDKYRPEDKKFKIVSAKDMYVWIPMATYVDNDWTLSTMTIPQLGHKLYYHMSTFYTRTRANLIEQGVRSNG